MVMISLNRDMRFTRTHSFICTINITINGNYINKGYTFKLLHVHNYSLEYKHTQLYTVISNRTLLLLLKNRLSLKAFGT